MTSAVDVVFLRNVKRLLESDVATCEEQYYGSEARRHVA